jgi:hypothetical protein
MNLQSQAIYVHKKNSNNIYVFLEDGASGEKVGDIEKIIVKDLFRI